MHAGLGGLHRVELVVPGRCRAGPIVDLVDRHVQRKGDITPHQFEARMAQPMRDVLLRASVEVVNTEHLTAFIEQAFAQMRIQESCADAHHNPCSYVGAPQVRLSRMPTRPILTDASATRSIVRPASDQGVFDRYVALEATLGLCHANSGARCLRNFAARATRLVKKNGARRYGGCTMCTGDGRNGEALFGTPLTAPSRGPGSGRTQIARRRRVGGQPGPSNNSAPSPPVRPDQRRRRSEMARPLCQEGQLHFLIR